MSKSSGNSNFVKLLKKFLKINSIFTEIKKTIPTGKDIYIQANFIGSALPPIKLKGILIEAELNKVLDVFSKYPGYIFNLGHGITPDINPDKIKFLTELIRSK